MIFYVVVVFLWVFYWEEMGGGSFGYQVIECWMFVVKVLDYHVEDCFWFAFGLFDVTAVLL